MITHNELNQMTISDVGRKLVQAMDAMMVAVGTDGFDKAIQSFTMASQIYALRLRSAHHTASTATATASLRVPSIKEIIAKAGDPGSPAFLGNVHRAGVKAGYDEDRQGKLMAKAMKKVNQAFDERGHPVRDAAPVHSQVQHCEPAPAHREQASAGFKAPEAPQGVVNVAKVAASDFELAAAEVVALDGVGDDSDFRAALGRLQAATIKEVFNSVAGLGDGATPGMAAIAIEKTLKRLFNSDVFDGVPDLRDAINAQITPTVEEMVKGIKAGENKDEVLISDDQTTVTVNSAVSEAVVTSSTKPLKASAKPHKGPAPKGTAHIDNPGV